jgi:hypothetical protein
VEVSALTVALSSFAFGALLSVGLVWLGRLVARDRDIWQERYYRLLVQRAQSQAPTIAAPHKGSPLLIVVDLTRLREAVERTLSDDDLHTLSFELGLELPEGATKPRRVLYLIQELRNQGRLKELVDWMTLNRPHARIAEE